MKTEACDECNGSGGCEYTCESCKGRDKDIKGCTECNGTGWALYDCEQCKGKGATVI